MPSTIVNIFHGEKEQIPTIFQIEGNIYQDIVTALIRNGYQWRNH